ncbi:MAG: protein translocase subunit SecD [Acidimicrobiales bacterium]
MALPKLTGATGLVALSIAGIVYTVVAGNQPLLGLDLQGGVSVVYAPTEPASEETLDQTLEIIRERVDALGVAEPEISRQGQTIVVDLPGVDEQQRALDLVGQTAELRFRPVIQDLGPTIDPEILQQLQDEADSTSTTVEGETTTETSTATDETTTTTASDTTTTGADDEQGMAATRYRRQSETTTTTVAETTTSEASATDETTTTSEAAGDDTTDTTLEGEVTTDTTVTELTPEQEQLIAAVDAACGIDGTTPPEADLYDDYVVLDDIDGNRICLGPALLRGDTLESADVGFDGLQTWSVSPVFKSGAEGIDQFNAAAAKCYVSSPDPLVCPSGRLAIVLDGKVISAPNIQQPSFSRDQIQISGSFDEVSARNLALVLNYGALPVVLEAQQTRTVSATIGDDVLRAGIIAGLIGLAIVALYLLWYYRLAGMVAIGGLVMSFMLLWTIISWLGETRGLAITLSGVVGLIVSIGVSADSNIVYFENVKDTVAHGKARKLTTAVERAYQGAISTILKADVVSLIAAGLLYFLTVGAVRGFAFYLGIATFLDLIVAYVFMRPALMWIARRPAVVANPKLLGIRQTEGLDASSAKAGKRKGRSS